MSLGGDRIAEHRRVQRAPPPPPLTAPAYHTNSTPYLGFVQALPSGEIYRPQQRFGMYRWHVRDPICFERGLRVTLQALGWRDNGRYLPLEQADVVTLALWYQHRSVTGRTETETH